MKLWIPENLISQKKLLLFVDDIDRCNEEKIIQVVDALKVMLENEEISKRIIIITALDERVLKMAIALKYHALIGKSTTQEDQIRLKESLAKEYIDKLFISGVKLGDLSINERLQIFDSITENKISNRKPESQIDQQTNSEDSGFNSITDPTPDVTSDSLIFNTPQYEIIEEDENFEIGLSEYDMLKNILQWYDDATPRLIRIFYYRYLLAKKIMKYKFKNSQLLFNKWNIPTTQKICLPTLIVHFSKSTNPKELKEELEQLENYTAPEISREYEGKLFTLDADLYRNLLKVVEMVVPY